MFTEDAPPSLKARKSLDFSTSQNAIPENDDSEIIKKLSQNEITNKKRTIQELFGDIDDLLFGNDTKKTKINPTELEIINQIIELRQKTKEKHNGGTVSSKNTKIYDANDNLSYRVPRFPFLAVTREDGERVYVRCHSEEYEKDELNEITRNYSFKNVMKDMYKETWKNAQELLNKQLDEKQNGDAVDVASEVPLENNCLWVELYKPRKYMELLSDETTNRTLLKWMKLWDKVVFNRKPKIKMATNEKIDGGKFKYKTSLALENILKLEEDGIMPEYKIALLCGPPGLGKKNKCKNFEMVWPANLPDVVSLNFYICVF